MPRRQFQRRSMLSATAIVAMLGVVVALATGCGGDASEAEETTVPTLNANATPLERLTAAYNDPNIDPSSDAWAALLADPGFDSKPITLVEFVSLKEDEDARANYDAYVDAFTSALTTAGGEMISVNDIMMPGLEGLEGYEGGVSWVATFPTIAAYVATMLDERVITAAEGRRSAVAEAHLLGGPNILPEVVLSLPPNEPASAFPSDAVAGKTSDEIIEELLAIYPSGGADPTRDTLEAMIEFEGWMDQRVHFINLYRFNKEGGAAALGEYNAGAFPVVVAHGGRPKVLVDITHRLVGPIEWDRFIFVSWPSLAVFTQLRLEPDYVEAQKDRVVSGEQYGNLINIARADQPAR